MRSLCRPTNDLLITGVLSSSVVTASDQCLVSRGFNSHLACVAWRFWLGALSNKGGRGQRNREEIGAEATWVFIFLAATRLLRPARQNRHATQAIPIWNSICFPESFLHNYLSIYYDDKTQEKLEAMVMQNLGG